MSDFSAIALPFRPSAKRRATALFVATMLLLAAAASLVLAQPASAAPGVTILEEQIVRVGCTVTVPVTVEDGGNFTFKVWDDGVVIHEETKAIAEGQTANFVWTIVSDVNQGVAGVGFVVVTEDGAVFDEVDPWDFEGSDDIARACTESEGSDSGETTTTSSPGSVPEDVDDSTTATAVTTPAPVNEKNAAPAARAQADPAHAVSGSPAYTG